MKAYKRIIAAMFFPVVAFLWFLGWSLYWIGNKSGSRESIDNIADESIDDDIFVAAGLHEEVRALEIETQEQTESQDF